MSPRRRTLATLLGLSLAPWRQARAQTPQPEAPTVAVAANLYAIEFRTGARWDTTKKPHEQAYFREHSANLKRLRDSGSLLVGARYSDKGLVVVTAETEASARALVEVDPSIQNQVFAFEVHAFHVFYSGCVQAPKRTS